MLLSRAAASSTLPLLSTSLGLAWVGCWGPHSPLPSKDMTV